MDRNEFIRRAQRYAAAQDEDCLVVYGGIAYYPESYTLAFRIGSDKPHHLATLHDIHANSTCLVPLDAVEAAHKEKKEKQA